MTDQPDGYPQTHSQVLKTRKSRDTSSTVAAAPNSLALPRLNVNDDLHKCKCRETRSPCHAMPCYAINQFSLQLNSLVNIPIPLLVCVPAVYPLAIVLLFGREETSNAVLLCSIKHGMGGDSESSYFFISPTSSHNNRIAPHSSPQASSPSVSYIHPSTHTSCTARRA